MIGAENRLLRLTAKGERGDRMDARRLETLKQLAHGIAVQFGDKCEVVIHDVTPGRPDHTIVHIENGHVSGRKVGDGASQVVLDQLEHADRQPDDRLCYLMRTPGGKILKCSTMYIRNSKGAVAAIFAINYDVTNLILMHQEIGEMAMPRDKEQTEPQKIINVNDVLEELITQSIRLVGKPVALMSKDDKIRAIRFLNDAGAFLVTKSGDKVAKYFGISKYTLYSYIDANRQEEKKNG